MQRVHTILAAYRTPLLFGVVVTCLLFVVAVFATTEERTIHIFPIHVSSDHWMKDTQALEQMLGSQAVFSDFTRENSAFVIVAEDDIPSDTHDTPQGAWGDSAAEADTGNTTDTVQLTDGDDAPATHDDIAPEDESLEPVPDLSVGAYLKQRMYGMYVHAEEVPPEPSEPADETEPTMPSESDEATSDASSPSVDERDMLDGVPGEEVHNGTQPAPSEQEDVRLCTVLDTVCHTIRFDGFDIGSILSDHVVTGYILRLSLGARAIGETFTPDKLVIRYFYRNTWHLAGEVTLDRELSNFDNGGHLAFPLPNLEGWDALKDFSVELEYVRQGTARTEVFLDSVWIDTTYEAVRADEVLPETRNVLTELAILEESGRPDLLIADGKRIDLTETDDTGGDLVLRSDRNVYDGLTTTRAYVAVTNRSEREERFRLITRTGKKAKVVALHEQVRNIQILNDIPTYSDVAYFCEQGWEKVDGFVERATQDGDTAYEADIGDVTVEAEEKTPPGSIINEEATTTTTGDAPLDSEPTDKIVEVPEPVVNDTFICRDTGEQESCTSFNMDQTNCISGNERVGITQETIYENGWESVPLLEVTDAGISGQSFFERLFGAAEENSVATLLTNVHEADADFSIAPRETRYFAIDLMFDVQRAGEFVVEVQGDEADASRTMWWRSAFGYRIPVTVTSSDADPTGTPLLYELPLSFEQAALFEHAALDGADIRLYDPSTRKEVPMRNEEYSFVDQTGHFLFELRELETQGSTTLYLYVGNEHVSSDSRALAPELRSEPIPYFSVLYPEDGAVLSLTSPYDSNTITVPRGEPVVLPRNVPRSVFVDSRDAEVAAQGPITIDLAEQEHESRPTSLTLTYAPDVHVEETARQDGRTVYSLARFSRAHASVAWGQLETLPIPAVGLFEPLGVKNIFDYVYYARDLKDPKFHELRTALKDFALGDDVTFELAYHPQKGAVSRFFKGLFNERLATVRDVHLTREGEVVSDARFEVVYGAEGEWTIHLVEMPRELVPGKYALVLTIDETGTAFTDAIEFYWGVLVVNTPQSTYAPRDLVEFHMAALDNKGDTICDAALRLTLTTPAGDSEEIPVEQQPTCGPNNVTDDPDYLGWYRPQDTGPYIVTLTHVNQQGDVVHQIADSFTVTEQQPFVIRRTGATRIWPHASYEMELEVEASAPFTGTLVEAVPEHFEILETDGGDTTMWGNAKRIVWDIDLEVGERVTLRYTYDAPNISPHVYMLGPAELRVGDLTAFREVRQWKLASDALGEYVERFVTITPTTADAWTTIDLSGTPYNIPANSIVEIALINTNSGAEQYAGVRHASSTLDRRLLIHEAETTGAGVEGMTAVTMHVTASATSSIQYYADDTSLVTFRILGYWTSGMYVERFDTVDPSTTDDAWVNWDLNTFGLTQGDVAEMVLAARTNNTSYYAGIRTDGSVLDRRAYINEEEAGGGNFATMHVMATTSTARVESYSDDDGGGTGAGVDFIIAGYWDTMPTGLMYKEAWSDLGGPSSNTTWTDRRLDNVSVPPTGIAEVLFGNGADANGAMEVGVRSNGSSLGRVLDLHEAETTAGDYNFGRAHVTAGSDASSTIEYYTESTTDDWFYLAGYWSAENYPPNTSTLYDVPFDNEKTGSSTPFFDFSATDPDGTSDITYQIQWDDDPDLDASPLGDEVSTSTNSYFINTVSPGDTSPFAEGNKVRFTIQSALTTGITYYWRVRAKDATGSNIYSEWSDVLSFTYVENTDPKGWLQTEDTQFDQGTLTGTETYGSNKVRLATTPPVGAMVAYGTGASTTPNVRTWNGTTWSASSSAQSVGGQISWVVLRAAPTRNEYILGTQDTGGDVNVQVYNGDTGTWGNLTELTPQVGNAAYKGFDIQYQSQSGDAVVAFCDGNQDPSYATWNGTSWSATSTIDLTFTQNCEWLSMAADPISDELIMVARANVAQTDPDYEAQVYNSAGGSWGSSQTIGAGDEAAREGIAIGYEESGNDAVVVVSNGQNNNFSWNRWDGASWNVANATVVLADDFEWGEIVSDDGTDVLSLCYIDEDNDMGTVFWNSTTNAWGTYREHDTDGVIGTADPDAHGRPVTCQYETTAGRDGYNLVAYSNTSNAEYNYYNGSAWQYTLNNGASISSVQDSWTVGSVRTGEGKILAVFHDNVNTRYDFSAWDGSSWTTFVTLDDNPSRTTEPWLEPVALAAQKYQESSGTIVSPIVDFDLVPNQPSWGEVVWNTTEPTATDVTLQVYYATTTATCNVLVPDGALAGNSTGFDVSASPLDISSLSTSTYNMLCVKATLTSTGVDTPTLEDWTLSWERQPYLTQTRYRWYVNTASTTPSDIWPSGGDALDENAAIPASFAPNYAATLRLRLGIEDINVSLSAGSATLKLQWAEGSVCNADMAWYDVGASGSSTPWREYDNGGVADGVTLSSVLLSTADTVQTYEEGNPTASNPNSIAVGDEGEWDFVLQHNATSSTNYCFRLIHTDGTTLSAYDAYPQLVTNAPPTTPVPSAPFDNEAVASTSPWFEFAADDVKLDNLHYQVQVDDDVAFGSTAIDRNSQDHFNDFTNLTTPADKSPFNAGELVRFIPTTALSNGTTYWWRVRARDPNGSGDWSEWSAPQSFTVNTSVTATTWFQTTLDQFNTDTLENVEATSTDAIVLTPPNTVGTATSPAIDYDWVERGNAWGSFSFNDTNTITYRLEYNNAGVWTLIPDSALAGNSAGFTTGPVSLLGIDPTTYNEIRVVAVLGGTTPSLNDWTVSWGYAVEQPTLVTLFDNEKIGTTTPSFTFYSTDPESNDLVYEISWSTDNTFTTSTTTRSSNTHGGFMNTASSTDTSPFVDGDTIRFTVQAGDALTNGTTYWWRVRARDPAPGADVWSVWSPSRSFTVDTSVTVSTWFQTTDEQFETDTLNSTEASGSDTARITTVVRDALLVYAEGVVQTPRYRIWNGTAWGTEKSASNIGERLYWARTAPGTTRDEYVLVTGGISGAVKAQVYTGGTQTWGTPVDMGTPGSGIRRGFDVTYETDSGDAMVVACRGADATYRTWNGTSWSATSTINLAFTQNCEWIELASDPDSDEIIMIARANPAETPYDFEAQVWNGASWGNSTRQGGMEATDVENIGMDIEYEESGGDAVFVTSNETNANFHSNSWNGTSWSGTTSVAIADDLETPKIRRDVGTDDMVLCFVANNAGIYFTRWTGGGWGSVTNVSIDNNTKDGSVSFDCMYETNGGRNGYVIFPYTDATNGFYRYWDTATLQPETALSTVTDSWAVDTVRTGDGTILAAFWDDANTNIDVSDWNGTGWSIRTSVETNVSTLVTPTVPMHMSARVYPSITSGSVVGTPIDFYDGTGPRWDYLSWNDTTPGASDIRYQIEYSTDDGESWSLVPDGVLPGNSTGSSTGPVSLADLPYTTYSLIRPVANFTCNSGDCPTLSDWTVTWSEGITVSGTAQQYDRTTNVTSGTVAVAVNGVLQSGKTGTISGGAWSIANVTTFPGDTITVFIDGAADANEATAVTKYDGVGNVTGITLYERHLTIGSNDATTTTNAMLSLYDYSTSGDEDLFFDVDTGNDLYVCASASGTCGDAVLYVANNYTYRADQSNSGTLYAHDVVIYGTTTADSNTFYVSGSWDNNGLFTGAGSSLIFTATSGNETIDATDSATSSYNIITLGQGSGTATWTTLGSIDVNGTCSITYGTLSASTSNLFLAGNLTIGASGLFVKGTGTTTFDGASTGIITDQTSPKQDLGKVYVDGSSKTVRPATSLRMTNLTIATANTFDVTASNHAIEIIGDFRNSGSFSAQSGTVTFTATTTGRVIDPGSSAFYNLTVDGVGGNWVLVPSAVTIGNTLTVATGTLTLTNGTTTVTGNITNSGGAFVHNNGTVELTGAGTKTLYQNGSLFFNLTLNGAGTWSFTDTSATSSGSMRLINGTLTFPTGTYTIGKSLINSGGTIRPQTGTLRFTSAVAETIRTNGSPLYALTVAGTGGTFSMTDTNVTASSTITFEQGTTTLPTGTLSVGGSFVASSGTFGANGGTVRFFATTTGFSVNPGTSAFNIVAFDSTTGGWTVTNSATSTGAWNLTNAASFTLANGATMEVLGTFTNTIASSTTWTGSTLYLNSGTAYTIGSKTQAPEGYGTLRVGANTDIRLWQSSSTAYTVDGTGSLYSQDHSAIDGDLYVWGDYLRSSGTDYWSYATDFDGTALGGGSRPVDVRFANGASARFTGSTLQVLGGASATTTLANQGSGSYALSVMGGTIHAQYYDVINLDGNGLSLLGSSTVSSLSDGTFTITTNGGTALTVSSSTIDTNPLFQPMRVSFSTSSGITSGYNVTASGTPSSYWWFKDSYGNYDGENYDNDPVAGPGAIRWDDSGYTISITGTVYAGEGGGGPSSACDGTNNRVRLLINGSTPYAVPCDAGTGAFTFPAVSYTGDVTLTMYLDGVAGVRGATVSRTPVGNMTGFDLYQDRIILRHEDSAPMTITQLATYDSDQDTDIPFDAETGTLTVEPEFGLFIWAGKTFSPGGNVTLNSGGSGATYDGSLHLDDGAVFVAAGTESHSIGGSWTADTGSSYTPANSTVTFTATTSSKTISPSSAFNNIVFSGSGGAWTIASTTIANGSTTVSSGTVSGTANITVKNGTLSGDGTVSMTGGTVTVEKGGIFGGTNQWTFANLTLGDGTSGVTTKNGTGAVTVTNTLTVAASHELRAGSALWTLTGSGSVLAVSGTFTADTSTTTFAGTSAMTVPALTYYNLVLAPNAGGSPTYTLSAGTPNAQTITIGNGTHAVTANANASDPLITVADDVVIRSGATLSASNANDLLIGGSYTNQGTFTANGGGVVFNSGDTGETINPGASAFHHIACNGAGGGWTIAGNATSTGNFSLTAGTSFAQQSGTQLVVQGVFTNGMGGSATTWNGSTLYLNSGTNYSINTKSAGGDVYGTLRIGTNTDIRMWNSTSTTYTVDSTGSLYSQDHNAVDGALYLWGDYERASAADYWSYATDFDGTNLASTSSERPVSVYLAANATTTLSGGTLEIRGGAGATTTVQNQGSGTYALRITGGTMSAQYYRVRNITGTGIAFSGSPTITELGNADLELSVNGGTMMTVAASVIDANPVKNWQNITFATSSGVSNGYNVTATGVSVSSWRFIPGGGNYYGESYDNDPAGNPGYLIFSDSDADVTVSGNVYSDEGTTVSPICNGSTAVVRLLVEGGSPQTTSCASGTGYYEISGITYAPGNTIMVYIDGTSTKAANITVDPVTSISDMHLYTNRVIVRHEDVNPISIADMAVYDSSDDADVPFSAATGSPDTLTLPVETKLIVWTGKTFRPGGNVTLGSGGSGATYDGTLELQASASLLASSTVSETYSIGGSWLSGANATFSSGLSQVIFTATTSGKTISPDTSPFYQLTFNGPGGGWTFTDRDATTTDNFTVTAGSVTLGTSTLAIGGSFTNNATLSAASTSIHFTSASAETVAFGGASVGSLTFSGSGAHTMTDTHATSTGSVTITAGSVVLPTGTFAVANNFVNSSGAFTHGGTLRLYGSTAAQNITLGTSVLRNLAIAGSGSWTITDANATTTGTTTILQGSLTAPSQSFGIGGSLVNTASYNSNGGLTHFFATTTGQMVQSGGAVFANVLFNGSGGGWTVATSATSTGSWRIISGAAYTMATGTRLEVQGAFENLIGGAATNWTDSVLYLNASGTSFTVNTKSAGGDTYAFLTLGENTDVRMWDSAASTTTVPSSSSLYSMDHNATAGDLYLWGSYSRSSGADYWSYATDFDGAALGGSSRQVDVRIASSSSLAYTGGTLEIIGTASATTTIAVQGTGAYSMALSGGTLNASYYAFRNLDATGVSLSGSLTVSSLSYGDFELGVNTGTMLTVAAATIDQNPSKIVTGNNFSTSTGITTGTNITLSGTTSNFWDFRNHYGTRDGELYDSDGAGTCGAIRWDDSVCLEVSQTHYRFRTDDGGGGAPNSEWYNSNWTKRKRMNVTNQNASTLTDAAVQVTVGYDGDMLSDFKDLRFTDDSGTTSLSYWIESYTTSATATVWVKVPSIPADDATYLFMYYGNASANNGESGTSTFSFFDDFEDDNTAEYSGDSGYFDTLTAFNAQGSYGLGAASGYENSQTPDGIYRTSTTFGQDRTIRWYQHIDATNDDEPCTLFGVQSPGGNNQNYAVCLDQYPSDKLVLAKNVSSNDGSGSVLASSTVSWTTQWYTVEVDWLTTNTIYVSVYNSAGTLFATTTASDSSYTSGGMGFSFWYQNEGWDAYTVRSYAAIEPTASLGLEQDKDGASWKTDQDTPYSQAQNETFRVRFSIENTGPQITGQQWRLQYADRTGYGTCAAVPEVAYDDVPNEAGCGTSPVCMVTTSQYTNGAATQQLLESDTYLSFTQGYLIESPSNQTSSMTLDQDRMTEVEYAIELTTYATADSYCMRTTNGGIALDSYQNVAEVTAKYEPNITDWILNMDDPIILVEGQTVTISATGTVTDLNGWADILYATSTYFRSGVGTSCSANDNNCYRLTSLDCPLNGCVANSCTIECTADIQFFAEPTDPSSDYAGEDWKAELFVVDSTGNVATTTSDGVELMTLLGIALTASNINYGLVQLDTDTGSINATSTLRNTGNDAIDIGLFGTDLTNGSSSIPVGNQKFATSSFTYAGCAICSALSGTASTLEVDLAKPTSTTPVIDDLYWGIYVPLGVAGTTHYGQNTFYATGD